MAGREFDALVDDLTLRTEAPAAITRYTIKDVPVPKPLERIVGGESAFEPKLDVAAPRIDETGAWMAADHALARRLPGTHFTRRDPGAPIVLGAPDVGNIDGIRSGPSLLNRDHFPACGLRVEGIGQDRHSVARRSQKHFAADARCGVCRDRERRNKKCSPRESVRHLWFSQTPIWLVDWVLRIFHR